MPTTRKKTTTRTTTSSKLADKAARLRGILAGYDSVLVAFSSATQDIVLDALALTGLEAIASSLDPPGPRPRTFPIHPLAITNPIWIDRAGDGFDAAGIPPWFTPAVEE